MLEISAQNSNKIFIDNYNQKSGLILINKPKNITSHDVVDEVRRTLKTRQVGHAGTLDPFAEGLLIVLVGSYTKKTDQFINFDKAYEARVIFGIETDSFDIEGKIISDAKQELITPEEIQEVIQKFQGKVKQYVPVFSSVKLNGYKLREIARMAKSYRIEDNGENKIAIFDVSSCKGNLKKLKDKIVNDELRLEIPSKDVNLKIELIDSGATDFTIHNELKQNYQYIDLRIDCSKGTYIRQLAYDIGNKLGVSSMLIDLKRTRIGEFNLSDALEIDKFKKIYSHEKLIS